MGMTLQFIKFRRVLLLIFEVFQQEIKKILTTIRINREKELTYLEFLSTFRLTRCGTDSGQ